MKRLLLAGVCLFFSVGVVAKKGARDFKVDSGGVSLHVHAVGDGAEVWILLNGGPGLSSGYMSGLESLVTAGRTVARYDQRGTGESSTPPVGKNTFEEHVADLEAVRVALEAEKVILVGHSWGGLVSMAYAGAHPERVAALVLVDSGSPTQAGLDQGFVRLRARADELVAAGVVAKDSPPPVGEDCTAGVRAKLPVYLADPKKAEAVAAGLAGVRCRTGVLRNTFAAVSGYDLRPPLAGFTGRVLVLQGEKDPFGKEMADEVAAAFPKAQVVRAWIADSGHFPWVENPKATHEAIAAFMKPRKVH